MNEHIIEIVKDAPDRETAIGWVLDHLREKDNPYARRRDAERQVEMAEKEINR